MTQPILLDALHADAMVGVMMRCVRHVGVAGKCTPAFMSALARHMEGREKGTVPAVCLPVPSSGQPDGVRFDALVLNATDACPEINPDVLLAPRAFIYVFSSGADSPPSGWRPYASWTWTETGRLAFHTGDPHTTPAAAGLILYAREQYDPVTHARELYLAGHPGWSLELLENVPDTWLKDAHHTARAEAERMLCLLAWDKAAGHDGRLNRFAKAMNAFYRAIALDPDNALALDVMAHFWARMERPDMARRWVHTAAAARCTPEMLALAENWNLSEPPESACAASLECPDSAWRPRILYLLQPGPDYGVDVLYDGLCDLLGDDYVVDYPWKGILHGVNPPGMSYYPCLCRRTGRDWSLQELISALRDGYFDLILFADVLEVLPRDETYALLTASNTPAFMVDMWDQCGDYRPEIEAALGGARFKGCFKREMLAGVQYAANTFPLPFSYPAFRAPREVSFTGRSGLFWAGKGLGGLRRIVLEHMVRQYGLDIGREYTQEAYTAALSQHVAGLCLTGNGFDTVRYWELPAHGCVLLAERLPIVIPNNFTDGVNALFFDDLHELAQKITWMQQHTAELPEMAAAGHKHLLRHHTGRVRAQQLLETMRAVLYAKDDHCALRS